MNWKKLHLFLVLIVATALGGCATSRPAPQPTAASTASAASTLAVWDRLYFGRIIPTGGEVTDVALAQFLAEVVTPRFPDGFTVIHGEGQWRGKSGEIVRERCFILDLNHPNDSASDRRVEEIALEYKRRFAQEAVFHVRLPAEARLH